MELQPHQEEPRHDSDCDCPDCREWAQVPKETRDRISAQSEDYVDWHDFCERFTSHPPDPHFQTWPADPGNEERSLILAQLDELLADTENLRRTATVARKRIDDFLAATKQHLDQLFGIGKKQRPLENADRDREWSKLSYQGKTYFEISHLHYQETSERIDEDVVGVTIQRHRKRRELLTRAICQAIWRRESFWHTLDPTRKP